ncbi:MAG: hypothetical protein M1339_00280, partial [Bacteroidetes bacterium]|nr:hypothetical protein [Bacteroidota bacterium]
RKTLKLKGRWYIVSWHTDLKVGAEKHTLWLSCNSGKKLRASFVVQVEGTKKLNKPNGIYK